MFFKGYSCKKELVKGGSIPVTCDVIKKYKMDQNSRRSWKRGLPGPIEHVNLYTCNLRAFLAFEFVQS